MTLPAGALTTFEIVAVVAGVAYAVLAARRNRLCWLAGAIASALVAVLSAVNALPMQAALQVFYIGMSVYGWWSWTRATERGELQVGVWPLRWHLCAAIVLTLLSWFSAHWLAERTKAAWPLLDSLTTWFSLFATWLAARARLENWIYWIVIDLVLVFLFYVQDMPFIALQFAMLVGIAAAGFAAWRRQLRAQVMRA